MSTTAGEPSKMRVVATIERRPTDEKEQYSSGSETGGRDSSSTLRKSEIASEAHDDDTEAVNLLTQQDSCDYDEDPSENDSLCHEVVSQQVIAEKRPSLLASRKDRQEVAWAALDRPRSTTPISIAPLEEFIRRSSLSPDPNAERIKLTLPGEQFNKRSPRKSNPQIWLDFCEKGLQSPRSSRRQKHRKHNNNNKHAPELIEGKQEPTTVPVAVSPNDAFTPVTDTPLTPVTPLDDDQNDKWTNFQDSFNPLALVKSGLISIPTECNNCECRFFKGLSYGGSLGSPADPDASSLPMPRLDPNDPESESLLPSTRTLVVATSHHTESESEDQKPLVSPNPCVCECHYATMLWRKASVSSDPSSVSSDISSRLNNSSSDDTTPEVTA